MIEAEVVPTSRLRWVSLHEIGKARAGPPHHDAPAFDALELGYHLQAWELLDGVQAQHEGTVFGSETFHVQLPGRRVDIFIQPKSPFTRSAPTRSGAKIGESRPVLK